MARSATLVMSRLLSPVALLSLALLVLLSSTSLTIAQPGGGGTQISICQTTFSSAISEGNYGQYWASQTYLTLTLNTTAAAYTVGAASVTAVTGSRSVSDSQGLGTVASSVGVTLIPTTSCIGCDNILYFPSGGTFDYFDGMGLALQLAAFQQDISAPTACATQTLLLRAGNVSVCDNDVLTAYNTLTVQPFSAAARAACVPPTLTLPAPTYCGIDLYNFTALATYNDLAYYDGYWTHILRLCGAVSQAECVSSYGSNTQACQYHGVPGYSVNVEASLNAPTGETVWSYQGGDSTGASGVVFNITDGTACGGYGPRKVNGIITCGTSNTLTNVFEGPTCTYNYYMTSPLACPPTQTFGFCAVTAPTLPATGNNWYSVISGTMTGSKVTGGEYSSANLLNSPTYQVTAISATMQLSSMGTGATATSATNTGNGTVAAANVALTLLPLGVFGGNDNIVYYADMNGSTPFLYTTQSGISLGYVLPNSQVQYAVNLWSLQYYSDNLTNTQQTAMVTYRIGSTAPAACYPPQMTAATTAAGQSQTFQYCGITYSSSVFDEYASTAYYSSKVTGTLTAVSTGVQGQWSVTGLTGVRYVTMSDGLYTQSLNLQNVQLLSGVPSYIYINSTTVAGNGVLDLNGLGIVSPGGAQTDPTGCVGSQWIYTGYGVKCATSATAAYSTYTNLANSFSVQVASANSQLQCNPVLYQVPAYTCGIGLYDFSSLKYLPDLSLTQNGYTIYMRLCGAVTQQDCMAQFGQNNMICQWGSSTNLYEISATNSPLGEPQFSYVNGIDGTSGVTMFIQDGQSCNAGTLYPRTTTVTILCGTTTQLASYREGNTCQYFMTLLTPLACPPPAPLQVGSTYCGIGNYNFTLLAYSMDLGAYAGGWDYYVRLCGAVRNPAVVRQLGGYGAMVAQTSASYGTYLLAATSNPATGGSPISFSYANGVDGTAGINYRIADGTQACSPTVYRSVNGTITCGTANVITQIYEAPGCNYNIFFQSPLACSGGAGATVPAGIQIYQAQPRTFAYCIISYSSNLVPGYSVWTTMLSGTIVAQQTQSWQGNWPVYQIISANGTRTVAKSDFSGSAGSSVNVLGVQTAGSTCFGNCNNLFYFVQGPNNTVWFDANGITFNLASAQLDLSGCNGTAINLGYGTLTCGNAGSITRATTSYTVNLVPLTGPGSNNNVAPACNPVVNTLQVSAPATCGIGSFDFSSLATYGDLSIVSGGYTIYGRLCGAVTQPDCVATFGANAQFCQWASSTAQYEMAALYAPTYEAETTFAYAVGSNANSGITYYVKDGANCSINNVQVPRSVQGTITCGTSTAFTYFAEVQTCTYVVNITTPLACVPTNTYSMCYIAYSNVLSDYTGLSWASLLSGTFTTSATLPASGMASSVITAFTGTRSIGSKDGLGRVLGSTTVTLGSTSTCANCNNQFYWPAPASGPFDNMGLQLTLGQYQVDADGCGGTSLTLKQYGLLQCGNGGAEQVTNPNNQIQIYPITNGFTPPACVPPTVVLPAQQCGIGPYNFGPLSTLGDISGVFGGYTLYLRMCGAVTQPDCVALYGNNVQVCQWAGKGSAYAEALYNSPTGETTWSYANNVDGTAGVVATIKDGQLCGGNGPRQAIVTLICGTTNAITYYNEGSTCIYTFTVTTPLACPPTQTFGFCATTSVGANPSYNNWYTVASGVLNTSLVSVATNNTATLDTAINLGSAPTYVVNAIIGGKIQISALGQGGTSNGNGAAATSAALTLLPPGTYGGNDNWVYYLNTGTPLLWTTGNGLSWSYPLGGTSGVTGNLYSLNAYGDSNTLSNGAYATVTYALLPAGTTSYNCPVPTLTAASNGVSTVTFQFCYISYVSNIFDEYANTIYPASVTSGSMSATQTGNAGQYKVNSLSGSRTYYVADGSYTVSASASQVSLGPGTSYVYFNSPLLANYSTTDAAGVALTITNALSSSSPDPAGCSGSPVYLQGTNEQCPTINTTNIYNQLVLQQGGSPALSCTPIIYQTPAWTCGIGPYDFSSLRALGDLNVTQNGYTIFMRLCGAVTQSDCVRQFGSNNMICQWGSSSNLYELSSNLSPFGQPQFQYINGYDAQNGISMIIADGQQCNSGRLYPRSSNITILCGATTQLVSYSEGDPCHYMLTLLTPLACPSPPVVVSSNGYCGIDNYNFTLLAYSDDIVGEFSGQSIWFRLCGAVRETSCVNTFGYTSQACQFQDGGGTYSLASASVGTGQTTFSYVNPSNPAAGIAYQIANGEQCGGLGARTLRGVITCGTTNSMLSFNEYSTCQYNVNITSPLACSGGIGAATTYSLLPTTAASTQNFGFCIQSYANNIINGYQLWSSTLSGVLTATTTASSIPTYTVTSATGTRITAASDYSGKTNSTATFTLAALGSCVGGCDNLIYYNPTVGTTPYVDGTGIALQLSQSQTEITGCSGPQITLNNFNTISCSASGQSTASYSFQLTPQTGTTAPTCNIPAGSTPTLSLQPMPTCGIGSVSFTSLAQQDLSITGGGYTIYGRLCGAVTQPDCVRSFGNNAQFCQWGSSSSQYEMASLQATNGETTFGYVNNVDGTLGYTYFVRDGATCNINGVTFPRSVQGNITCGTVANFTLFYEMSAVTGNSSLACHYVVNIVAPVACLNGVPTGATGTTPTSSTGSTVNTGGTTGSTAGNTGVISGGGGGGSSLSGGAIAGIVIGSVVGASILLAIMIFICCGIGAGGMRKQGTETKGEGHGVEHSGKFAPQEESRVQSEVAHNTDDEGVEMAHP